MGIKEKEGISLIVLVITIIIMIILAAVIVLSLYNNKIIENAKEAVAASDMATAKNIAAVAAGEWDMLDLRGETVLTKKKHVEEALEEAGISPDDKILVTEAGEAIKSAPIPMGFEYKEGTIETGFVIIDITEGKTKENEFVWIPVENINKFVREDGYKNGVLQTYVSGNITTEPCSKIAELNENNDTTKEYAEYSAMKASVEENKGFYIARYEIGKENIDGEDTAVSKKGSTVWNNIAWGDSMTSIGTTGAVYRSRQMYEENENMASHLIYGVQWDAAMRFVTDSRYSIKDSTLWGNHKDNPDRESVTPNKPAKTGAHENWKVKNIYDLAGNVSEWTMEAYTTIDRIYRGGNYDSNGAYGPVSYRSYNTDGSYLGFRVALYIK